MKITLHLDDGEKDFFLPEHIKGSMTFEATKLMPELEKEFVPEDTLKKVADFIARVYGNKFTAEEFIDGTHVWVLTITMYAVCTTVLGRLEEALKLMNTVEDTKKKLMELQKKESNTAKS